MTTVNLRRITPAVILFSIALMPLIGLLWNTQVGPFKLNWVVYPFVTVVIVFVALFRNSVSKTFLSFIALSLPAIALFVLSGGRAEEPLRILFSVLPLLLWDQIAHSQTARMANIAMTIYLAGLIVPITFGVLQFTGHLPFNDYDTVDGVAVGRMSGGYSKPNNFVIFTFPLLLFGIRIRKQRKLLSAVILTASLVLVYFTGLRIALLIYSVILFSLFYPKLLIFFVRAYYTLFLNFLIPAFSFYAANLIYRSVGFIDIFRGRFELWQIHSYEFFTSSLKNILFGKGEVHLMDVDVLIRDGHFHAVDDVSVFNEVHNNSFRILVIFGFAGLLVYSLGMRYFVLKILRSGIGETERFIAAACFSTYLFYSITNEPIFYPAIFWCIFFSLFVRRSEKP